MIAWIMNAGFAFARAAFVAGFFSWNRIALGSGAIA